MININMNNSKCHLSGDAILIEDLRERTKIKVKNAFFAPQHVSNGGSWDGFYKPITDSGYFKTGYLGEVIALLKKLGKKYHIEDRRGNIEPVHIVTGFDGFEEREYQEIGMDHFFAHKIGDTYFQRGIFSYCTNSGKSYISACIYASYGEGTIGLLLINNKVIFNQLVKELTDLLGKDVVGYVSSEKGTVWKQFNICMVQTLGNRAKTDRRIRDDLAKAEIIIVDEADEVIHRKDSQTILSYSYNASVRIAVTGSAGMSKDKVRNSKLIEYFGPVITTVKNKELVDKGYSAKPTITILKGNQKELKGLSYVDQYEMGITKNKGRHRRIWERVQEHIDNDDLPVLIICRYHKHIERLFEAIPKDIVESFRVQTVHGGNANREQVLEDFRNSKIDILISSLIIKRGKNLPTIRSLINAAGGDSHETIVQLLGRALRIIRGVKDKVNMDDFHDKGKHLFKHSNHRVRYYKEEKFPVEERYKK